MQQTQEDKRSDFNSDDLSNHGGSLPDYESDDDIIVDTRANSRAVAPFLAGKGLNLPEPVFSWQIVVDRETSGDHTASPGVEEDSGDGDAAGAASEGEAEGEVEIKKELNPDSEADRSRAIMHGDGPSHPNIQSLV